MTLFWLGLAFAFAAWNLLNETDPVLVVAPALDEAGLK